jgi:hypothetical protein
MLQALFAKPVGIFYSLFRSGIGVTICEISRLANYPHSGIVGIRYRMRGARFMACNSTGL